MSSSLKPHRILIVDDEPDVHSVTRMTLRRMTFGERPVELASAYSGTEAIDDLRAHPETAVVLMDVVMESNDAGLKACERIRSELSNHLTRLLLRTGQPGHAPERECIDSYDIDGYLPKAELSSTRLYAAVRTAIKAFDELEALERHRSLLAYIHESIAGLRPFDTLEQNLQRILATATSAAGATRAVLELETVEETGEPRHCLLWFGAADDAVASRLAAEVSRDAALRDSVEAVEREQALYLPLKLPRDMGRGWIHLEGCALDPLTRQALAVLVIHAANALYANVALSVLEAREGPFYDSMSV